LQATACAICGQGVGATELYPANFDLEAFNTSVFSARRLPDGIRYRMVRCANCGLVRSDPVADPAVLAHLYKESTFDYDEEVDNLKATYGRYLRALERHGVEKGALLEIGCGNGFVLEEALAQGYRTVKGVEPSTAAVAKAEPSIRPHLVCDIMRPGLFAPESFEVVTFFQVFDHLPDPGAVLDQCFEVLKPGGLVLCLNHNVEALSARLLRERSPIIDIEHTYLYTPTTLARIFTAHGFKSEQVLPVYNTYTTHYLTRLVPLPGGVKTGLLKQLRRSKVGRTRLSVPLGNLCLIARKPLTSRARHPGGSA
jgi:2-polyprenyl-3-methyl-5-hydroxy-6-metoxy-1,4-benzoquinol methylase